MAHTFITAQTFAAQALGMLERELILPRLMTRYGASDFVGASNDTVNVKIPAKLAARDYEWRTRVNAIVMDDIVETSFPVTLSAHPYSAVTLTDEQMTLDIVNFGSQVLRPQVRAVAERLEAVAYTAMSGADLHWSTINLSVTSNQVAATEANINQDAASVRAALVEARRRLNVKNVPVNNRVILVGADVEAVMLNGAFLQDASQAGDPGALRDATLGRILGMPVITSNSIPAGEAWVFHETAFAFANVAPVVPRGAAYGASINFEGLAMTHIQDYDPSYLRDRSVVSSFAGAASVEEDPTGVPADGDSLENIRAVKILITAS